MKRTITRTALATLVLLLSLAFSSLAQTPSSPYYDLYLCDDATATLHPEEPVTPLKVNDKVYWYLDGIALPDNPRVYNGTATSIDLLVPVDLAVGIHRYTSIIQTAENCMGEESSPFTIYKLPTKTLTLNASVPTYCAENSNSVSGSVITATTTHPNGERLPEGIEYAYEWTVTLAGTPPTTVTPGSSDNSNAITSVYTMNTTAAGTYVFDAKVKYVRSNGNTGAFRSPSNNGCEVSATATAQVIVTPRPAKPTIKLVP